MGAGDILNNSNTDLDAARAKRDNKNNPPSFASGQDVFSNEDDIFSNSFNVTPDNSSFGGLGDTSSSPFGGSPFGGSPFGLPQNTPAPTKSSEDKIFDAIGKGGKGLIDFFKDMISSVGQVTPKFWANWGTNVFLTGLVVAVVGVVLLLFKIGLGLDLLIGGLLAGGGGVVTLLSMVDKANE